MSYDIQSAPLILTHDNFSAWSNDIWQSHLSKFPAGVQKEIVKYMRWQDRQATLLGKMLLQECLKLSGLDSRLFDKINYTKYRRPEFDSRIDFNISHAPGQVVCALYGHRLGIDIEKVRQIDVHDFRSVLTRSESKLLNELPEDQRATLFTYIWTRKEAAIKADGKGFYNKLTDVNALGNTVALGKNTWHTYKIKVDKSYICHLATKDVIGKYQLRHCDLINISPPK